MVQLKKHTSKKILSRLKRFTGVKIFQSELGNVKAAAKVVMLVGRTAAQNDESWRTYNLWVKNFPLIFLDST